jgi:hypothetical protein
MAREKTSTRGDFRMSKLIAQLTAIAVLLAFALPSTAEAAKRKSKKAEAKPEVSRKCSFNLYSRCDNPPFPVFLIPGPWWSNR